MSMSQVLLVLGPFILGFQTAGEGRAISLHPEQPDLRARAEWFATAWAQRDASALGGALLPQGIHLKLPGEEHILIPPRQAEAAIRSFMEGYEEGAARVSQVSLAGGDPRKGFAEIRWETRGLGGPDPVVVNLFVGFGLEDDVWQVTEIRILS